MQMNPDSVSKGVGGIKNYLTQKSILKIQDLMQPETISQKILESRRRNDFI